MINTNDNYKNKLQVLLQQNFKITPIYKEISEWTDEDGYHMGVYLSINKKAHEFTHNQANTLNDFNNIFTYNCEEKRKQISYLEKINIYNKTIIEDENNDTNSIVIFLTESKHKIKKKAEQSACKEAFNTLNM